MRKYSSLFFLMLIFLGIAFKISIAQTSTNSAVKETELRNLIESRTKDIELLEAQINAYQNQLKQLGGEKQSLQNQIKSFDITKKKLETDISLTQERIERTSYQLEVIALDIRDKSQLIDNGRTAIAEGIRIINGYDQISVVERLLDSSSLTDIWTDMDSIQTVQKSVKARIIELGLIKEDLEDKQDQSIAARNELLKLRNQLSDQKKVVEYNTQQKNALLAATKSSEANYQKMLKEKMALRDSFLQELLGFESELKLITSQSQIPDPVPGMLSWPLSSIYITQTFGDTEFSRANSLLYNGNGHNGIDFRASIGTPVLAAASGTVTGTGNTDTVCPGASYGKWVLIRHNNGLSTLYAHLSIISVSEGESVSNGATIGYSGNTGYSTGPHLHFTVYATAGLQVASKKSLVCKGTYIMPLADLKAYLNPLAYLPEDN